MEMKKQYMAPRTEVRHLSYIDSIMEVELTFGSTTNEALTKYGFWFKEDEDVDNSRMLDTDLWDDEVY